jgi:hypothetical protein
MNANIDSEEGRRLCRKLARVSLCVFFVGFIVAQTLLLAVAGGYVGVYTVLAGVALAAMFTDEVRVRFVAVVCAAVCLTLIVGDHESGMKLQLRIGQIKGVAKERYEHEHRSPASQPEGGGGAGQISNAGRP